MSYSNVVRGGLKLKETASTQPVISLSRKQKRKKPNDEDIQKEDVVADPENVQADIKSSTKPEEDDDAEASFKSTETEESPDNLEAEPAKKKSRYNEDDYKDDSTTAQLLADVIGADEHLTSAEKAFRLAQKNRDQERINKRLELTHRQRMEKFNAQLKTLPERDLNALYKTSSTSLRSSKKNKTAQTYNEERLFQKDEYPIDWAAPKLEVPLIPKDDIISIGTEVPYRFRIAAPESLSKKYSRDTSSRLTYTDFSGLRYPTLRTAENYPNYWLERGVEKLKLRVSPLYLPAHKRLSPYLREVMWFLHTLDPVRFTKQRIGERYGLKDSSIRRICHEMSEDNLIKNYRLTRRQRRRLTEAQAVERRKEEVYAARLGYELMGDQRVTRSTRTAFLKGAKYYDPILKQSIHVEAMTAFPLPSLRDPVQRKFEIDVEVKSTNRYKVINWIDPSDKVAI